MKAKLTLTIEKSVIERAKEFASSSGKSLSDLIETYLEKEIIASENKKMDVPEEFQGLFGAVKLPANLNEKEVIRSILREKNLQ